MKVQDIISKVEIKVEKSKPDMDVMLEECLQDFNTKFTSDDFTALLYSEDDNGLIEVWGVEGTSTDFLGEPDYELDDKIFNLYERIL